MRIAILADPIDNQQAGIHHYTIEFLSKLAHIKTENEYSIIRLSEKNPIHGIDQVVIKNYPWIPGYKALRMFFLLPLLLTKMKFDVVVEPAHFGPFNLPKRIRRVTVIHDMTPVYFPHYHRIHSQLLQRIFLKDILKRADLIIANSQNTKKDIVKYVPSASFKVYPIYLGKDDSFSKKEDPAVLKKYNLDQPFFLYVGTIEPRKNLLTLLEAFRQFKSVGEYPHYLVIVGQKGWKTKTFFSKLSKHPNKDHIRILGYVAREDLPVLYSSAQSFILPSYYEGFGMPLLEAMSCGAPCIISHNSSLPEIGGNAALKFDPENPAELAMLMKDISDDEALRKERSSESLLQSKKFSWENYAIQFDELISQKLKKQ
ncbi:MAG: glycosyltransferase family 4 protein [Bacteroidetes bacterium]|nr:glycosyltransferase family 4 protein [Bacteroidota bacterium]